MTKTGILLVGFLLSSTSIFAFGCSDPASTETGGSGGSEASSSSSSTGSSSSGTAGAGGSGGSAASGYCAAIMANCTGADAQYTSQASCEGVENGLPPGLKTDTSGNTVGCRTYHAGAAKADAATHCVHAGPAGGGAAFCGTTCEGFCAIATATCKTEWPDKAACMTACAAIPSNGMKYNTSFTSGNTIECRLYHLSVAASDAASATTHCPHTSVVSSQCM